MVTERRHSTQTYLLALFVAVVVPLLIFAGIVLTRYANAEREGFEQEAARVSRQIALAVDGELQRLLALLSGLAVSSQLQGGDLAAFHAEAQRLVTGSDYVVVLREMSQRQLLNTQLPFGRELPPAPPIPVVEAEAFAAGKPVVSHAYASPTSGEIRIAVAMPVPRAGQPSYVIAITVPTARIRDVVVATAPADWIIGIADRAGVYVARSIRHDEATGKPGLPEFLNKAVGRAGTFMSMSFDRLPILAGYYRSEFSGWLFAASIPQPVVEAPLWRSLLIVAALGVAAFAVSILFAYLFGRRLSATAEALAVRAQALGEGRTVEPMRTRLREYSVVADALGTASRAIEERAQERERGMEREALLSSIFDTAGLFIGIIEMLPDDFRFIAASRSTAAVLGRKGGVHGMSARELGMSVDEIALFTDLWRRCKAGGRAITTEYGLTRRGTERGWYVGTFTAFPSGPNGRPRMAFTAIDISDRKRGEEQRRLLVNELNHRVKNTLAIVHSLVVQTLRGAASMNEARTAVGDRLVALAKAHDVLTRENWESADLRDLLDSVLAPHQRGGRFTLAGPPVRVNPNLALAIALALHELCTNAAKYGALAGEAGTVAIAWEVKETDDAPWLTLRWQEHDGPPVKDPARRGFGSRLIEDSFAYSIGGSARIEFAADGVICIVRAPLAAKAA